MNRKNSDNENSRYKITSQSGLYYENDMIRIIDDPISDRIYNKIVNWILRICMGIDLAIYFLHDNDLHIISTALIFLSIIIWIVCGIIHRRIEIVASLRNNEEDIIQKAMKERKYFVIGRIITLVLSILSVILSVIGIWNKKTDD